MTLVSQCWPVTDHSDARTASLSRLCQDYQLRSQNPSLKRVCSVSFHRGDLAQMGISFTAGSVLMKYSGDAEREADMVGAQIIYDAGFNPQSMVSFFRKLEQEGSNGGPEFLNSHPNPGNRAQDVQAMLSRYPPKEYPTTDSAAFLDAKTRLANLPPPAPGGGPSTRPPAAPRLSVQAIAGRNFQGFRHSQYSITYPTSWRVEVIRGRRR